MKNASFLIVFALLLTASCRTSEDSVQRVDQVLNIYIDSAGQDLLNTKLLQAYTEIRMNDVYGLKDTAPVNFTLKQNADTLNYIEYVAGARRIIIDSSAAQRSYESKIAFAFAKKINDSTKVTVSDTLKIQYLWTPTVFRVADVWYNGNPVKLEPADLRYLIKISK